MRQRVQGQGVGAAITVASAGVGTQEGWPIDPTTAGLLAKRGVLVRSDFSSHLVTGPMLGAADLILTGTRDHRLRIGSDWPEAYPRTFTLRESARLLAGMPAEIRGGLSSEATQRPPQVVRWLQDERGTVVTPESGLDISDPIGRRTGVYRRMLDQVYSAVDVLADALLPRSVPLSGHS